MIKIKEGPAPEPWERQPDETPKAWQAFIAYRDMENRSIREVARILNKSATLIAKWSGKNEWTKRVAAWDEEMDRIAREAQIKEIQKMRKRHANIAYAMLIKASDALKSIPKDEIKAADIPRMVEVGTKLERISRGDAGEVLEERPGEASPPVVTFYMPDNHRDKKEGASND